MMRVKERSTARTGKVRPGPGARAWAAALALPALFALALPAAALEGGMAARAGDALSQVTVGLGTITRPDEDLRLARCSGVLVGADLVLTAAHCVRGDPLGSLVVFYRGGRPVGRPAAARVIARYTPDLGELRSHEVGADLSSLSVDLAVLRLTQPVAGRVPVPLAVEPGRLPASLEIAGTGLSGNTVGRLRTARLQPVAAAANGLTIARVVGARVCYGDSGGPVVGRDRRGVYVWGVASAVITDRPPCGNLVVVAPAAQVFTAAGIAP
jgi:hypothetical protein